MASQLPCSPRTPVRVVPAWRVAEGQANPPAFYLRIPTAEDRANIDSDLFVAGARPFGDGDLHRELKKALKALIDPEQAAKAATTIDEYAAALEADRERRDRQRKAETARAAALAANPDADDAAVTAPVEEAPDPALAELSEEIDRFEQFVSQHWEQYRVMLACRQKRLMLYPLFAARRLLTGWEGLDGLEFKAGIDGRVRQELWNQLDERDLRDVGWEGVGLLHLTPGQRGN